MSRHLLRNVFLKEKRKRFFSFSISAILKNVVNKKKTISVKGICGLDSRFKKECIVQISHILAATRQK